MLAHDLCDLRFAPVNLAVCHTDALQCLGSRADQEAANALVVHLPAVPFVKLLGKLLVQMISRTAALCGGFFAVLRRRFISLL